MEQCQEVFLKLTFLDLQIIISSTLPALLIMQRSQPGIKKKTF